MGAVCRCGGKQNIALLVASDIITCISYHFEYAKVIQYYKDMAVLDWVWHHVFSNVEIEDIHALLNSLVSHQ